MKKNILTAIIATTLIPLTACAASDSSHGQASDKVIAEQRAMLEKNTDGKGFGPQSPRDIDAINGVNTRAFNSAPASAQMNLCNIHFHKNAEHKGGEFAKYAGNGDGHGFQTGFVYSGKLSSQEKKATKAAVCPSKHGALNSGDTIEVHYVHSSAQVTPGPTLGACLSDAIGNPQLRVETQVMVLVNDKSALDFNKLTKHGVNNGYQQALNIPSNMGTPVQYTRALLPALDTMKKARRSKLAGVFVHKLPK